MNHFSVYFNPISQPLKVSTAEMKDLFTKLVIDLFSLESDYHHQITTGPDNPNKHHFLLKPLSAALRLIVNTSDIPDKNNPKITATSNLY